MTNLFGIDIATQMAEILSPVTFDQVLIKISTERDATDRTLMNRSETSYSCKGFVDNYSSENIRSTSVQITDVKIVILVATLPSGIVPEPGDKIEAEGTTYTIPEDGVIRDAAAATYECRGR